MVGLVRTGPGMAIVAWGWTDTNPMQFFYRATSSGEFDVAGAISGAVRKAGISGLAPGKIWRIAISSIDPDTDLGSITTGIIWPNSPSGLDVTSGDPPSTCRTFHWSGSLGMGGDPTGEYIINVPGVGRIAIDKEYNSAVLCGMRPDTDYGTGEAYMYSENSGGRSTGNQPFAAFRTGAAGSIPDLDDMVLEGEALADMGELDFEEEEEEAGLGEPFPICSVSQAWRWVIGSIILQGGNDVGVQKEIDTWDVYIEGEQVVFAAGRYESKSGYWETDYKWRLSFGIVGTTDPHVYLYVGSFGISNFRYFGQPGGFSLRVDATNAHGTAEGPTVIAQPTCEDPHPYLIRVPTGAYDGSRDDEDPTLGNPDSDEMHVDDNELDFPSAGDEDIVGRKHPHGVYVGSNMTTTYELGKIFTVPRTDAAVKADAGYSDIRQAGFGGSQADVHMILQEKSFSKLHPIRPGARRHVLVNDVIDKFLKTPNVTLSIGTDGSLTLSDTDRGSLNISDGYDLGAITLQDDDNGSILLTETEQVPVSYIGEKL